MKAEKIISLSPSNNYAIIGEVLVSTRDEIMNAITQAHVAQPLWAALGCKDRIVFLNKVYQEFEKRKNEIALLACKEMGMPISVQKLIDIEVGLLYMRGYLDYAEQWLAPEITFENDKEIHYLFFEPRGVAGISMPWNFPFTNFIWGVIQNLVVGNTVVFKHSEECPLTGKLLEEIMYSNGLPEGVFNEVYGDGSSVGETLMNSAIDLIHFTGSTAVGKHLYQVAAKKFIPAILELGGSAPGIVFEDADLAITIESIYLYRFTNSGQVCDGLKRLIVHKSIYDEVVQQLKKLLASKKVGNSEDPTIDIGPLVSKRQLLTLEAQVADALKKGARIITGAKQPTGLSGAYYEPTILTNITFDMLVWKEEVFGPVLPIVSFTTEDEAVTLANDTQYGLGAYIYTKNKERALRISSLLQTGNININNTNYNRAEDPFGGYKNSGLGREHGKQGLRELCNIKVVAINK